MLFQGLVGLSEAMYLWLVAAGLSLIFGVMRVLNFAHGSLYMLGAYFAWVVVRVTGSFWLALLIGPAVVAGVGWAMEFGFLRRVYSAPEAFQLLLTFAFVLMFDDAVKLVFGPVYQSPPTPAALSGAFVLGRSILPTYHLFILAVGGLVGLGLWLFLLEKTSFGLVIRATAADREMARALGVRASRLFTWVFILGAALAGLGGALSMPVRAISPGMGEFIIIEAFVVVVLGGLGSLRGAFVGALLIGLLHAYGLLFMPVFELALGYLAMAAVLIVRPWGLFGARES